MSPVHSAHHAVGQAELLQNGFGMARHGFQRFVAFVGMDDLHHLHLVELVLADQTARVAPALPASDRKARCVGSEFDGQVGFGHHHVAHEVGQ
jgi:hypothetical protein